MHRPRVRPNRRSGVDPTKLALTSMLAASAFTVLSAFVEGGGTKHLDRAVRRRMQPRKRPRIRDAANMLTSIASPHTHPLIAVALGIIASRRTGRIAYAIFAASVGATVVDKVVRLIIHQKRPPLAGVHHGLDRYAFPSGHTCAATAIALAFVIHIWPTLSEVQRRAAAALAISLSLGVGWTRLYLDEHWIDDIIGGCLAGVTVGSIASA
ncbi:MAG: phosphatase PAP2 family protein [Gemmatimonadaceae bacterium]